MILRLHTHPWCFIGLVVLRERGVVVLRERGVVVLRERGVVAWQHCETSTPERSGMGCYS